jgi:UDP-N-acetylglucosamine 2-epimerase
MEVREIISSFINKESNILKVEFRFIGDEGVRQDFIEFEYVQEFGYDNSNIMDVFESLGMDDEWDDWDSDDSEGFMDDETIISFLNEYYIVFPEKIPDEEYI